FCFTRDADTGESVMKEMEDERLAEEGEIELIKAHMENLIIKIDECLPEDKERSEEEHEEIPCALEYVDEKQHSLGDVNAGLSLSPHDASEESSDYSIKDFKDSQNIS